MSRLTAKIRKVIGPSDGRTCGYGRGQSWLYVSDDHSTVQENERTIQRLCEAFPDRATLTMKAGYGKGTFVFFVYGGRKQDEYLGSCKIDRWNRTGNYTLERNIIVDYCTDDRQSIIKSFADNKYIEKVEYNR